MTATTHLFYSRQFALSKTGRTKEKPLLRGTNVKVTLKWPFANSLSIVWSSNINCICDQ